MQIECRSQDGRKPLTAKPLYFAKVVDNGLLLARIGGTTPEHALAKATRLAEAIDARATAHLEH